MKILRYQLDEAVLNKLHVPAKAKVVDAVWQEARQEFSIYVEVEEAEVERDRHNVRQFIVYPTGAAGVTGRHIRSIVMPDGFHVYHVYEVTP